MRDTGFGLRQAASGEKLASFLEAARKSTSTHHRVPVRAPRCKRRPRSRDFRITGSSARRSVESWRDKRPATTSGVALIREWRKVGATQVRARDDGARALLVSNSYVSTPSMPCRPMPWLAHFRGSRTSEDSSEVSRPGILGRADSRRTDRPHRSGRAGVRKRSGLTPATRKQMRYHWK